MTASRTCSVEDFVVCGGDENKARHRPEVPVPAMVAVEASFTEVSMACVAGLATSDPLCDSCDPDYGECF